MIRFPELLARLKRGPQVMLPKDIGMVLGFTGVGRRSVCVDAGAGSGWLAVALGNVCRKVVAYEWREDFAKLAEDNVKRAGLQRYVKIKRKNIFDGIEEKNVDLVTLDMADSDRVVPHAFKALREGGMLVGYFPHAEQVQKFVRAARETGFREDFTIECMVREMLAREQGFRPDTTGLWHTGYLVFAKK